MVTPVPVPPTGPIDEKMIKRAFPGETGRFKISNYYRGGELVADTAANAKIPKEGKIKFTDFRGSGGPAGTAGEKNYETPGHYDFIVPEYGVMTVDVGGPGAGAGSSCWDASGISPGVGAGQRGSNGTEESSFDRVLAGMIGGFGSGGGGCIGGSRTGHGLGSPPGPPGNASGGDQNIEGGGGRGGRGVPCLGCYADTVGGPGGNGGRCTRNFTKGIYGSPVPGATIKVVVGGGGAGGPALGEPGLKGSDGWVRIKWTA